jgi:hypothetical protein
MVAHENVVIRLGEIAIINLWHFARQIDKLHWLNVGICYIGVQFEPYITTVHVLEWCLRRDGRLSNRREEPELDETGSAHKLH